MNYAEASYFDGFAFAHIAARDEDSRRKSIAKRNRAALADWNRRTGSRARHA